jgi:hypothetical protein
MATVKITGQTEDGTEVTISVDDESLPDGLVTETAVRDSYVSKSAYDHLKGEVEKRIDRARRKAFDDGLASLGQADDDDEIEEVVSRFRDAVGDDRLRKVLGVKSGQSDEERTAEIERLTAQVRKREVEPLNEQLGNLQSTVELLRGEQFRAEFRQAAAEAEVDTSVLPFLEDHYMNRVVFDDERGKWWIRGEDGEPALSTAKKEDGEPPFRTIREDLGDLKASGERDALFRSSVRDGAGFRGSDRKSVSGAKKKASEMSRSEKSSYISEHGLDAWKEHVASAG